jgi:hypothetical protein
VRTAVPSRGRTDRPRRDRDWSYASTRCGRGHPGIVYGVGCGDRGDHAVIGFLDLRVGRIIEEEAGKARPSAPLQIRVAGQVFAHAQLAPGQVAVGTDQDRADNRPQEAHPDPLGCRHPPGPPRAGTEGVHRPQRGGVRHQPQRHAAKGVSDHVERSGVLGSNQVHDCRKV